MNATLERRSEGTRQAARFRAAPGPRVSEVEWTDLQEDLRQQLERTRARVTRLEVAGRSSYERPAAWGRRGMDFGGPEPG